MGERVVGRMLQIWRYPVKSVLGERLEAVAIGLDGVAGDRRYAVADRDTGAVLTAKRHPRLLECRAETVGTEVMLWFPDGAREPVRSDAAGELLSDLLGRYVEVVTADDVRRDAPHRGWRPPAGPGASLVDDAPVHVLTVSELAAGRALHDTGEWRPERFRPNLVVEDRPGDRLGACDALAVGGAVLERSRPCERCVMVSHAQPGLARDRDILGTIVRSWNAQFGLYLDCTTAGRVGTGESVRRRAGAGAGRS